MTQEKHVREPCPLCGRDAEVTLLPAGSPFQKLVSCDCREPKQPVLLDASAGFVPSLPQGFKPAQKGCENAYDCPATALREEVKQLNDMIRHNRRTYAHWLDRLAPRGSDEAYRERNRLVAALANLYPSGVCKTAIEGWDPAWHNCCFIDTPEGQMSWHYHDKDAALFAHLPEYTKPARAATSEGRRLLHRRSRR